MSDDRALSRSVAEAAEARAGCPTCEGPSRETVGMVCQTCGTDYGAGYVWRPEGTLQEVVGMSIGAGSVCWVGGTGSLEFDSEKASAIVDGLMEYLAGWEAQVRKQAITDAITATAKRVRERIGNERADQVLHLSGRDERLPATEGW